MYGVVEMYLKQYINYLCRFQTLAYLKNVKLIDGLVKSDNYASNMVNIVYFLNVFNIDVHF